MTKPASVDSDDDHHLLARLMSGDTADANRALATIIARFRRVMERTVWSIVHDRDAVGDVMQDIWLTCWNGRQTLIVCTRLREYLICIARTRALNWRRGERRRERRAHHATTWRQVDDPDTVENDAIYSLAADDHAHDVHTIVAAMPHLRRLVYTYVIQDGYTHDETAKLLNMAPRTVSNHMWHANQDIRRGLTQLGSAFDLY
jgi:RNA polymerase sigma factor (sigma-70 family)